MEINTFTDYINSLKAISEETVSSDIATVDNKFGGKIQKRPKTTNDEGREEDEEKDEDDGTEDSGDNIKKKILDKFSK